MGLIDKIKNIFKPAPKPTPSDGYTAPIGPVQPTPSNPATQLPSTSIPKGGTPSSGYSAPIGPTQPSPSNNFSTQLPSSSNVSGGSASSTTGLQSKQEEALKLQEQLRQQQQEKAFQGTVAGQLNSQKKTINKFSSFVDSEERMSKIPRVNQSKFDKSIFYSPGLSSIFTSQVNQSISDEPLMSSELKPVGNLFYDPRSGLYFDALGVQAREVQPAETLKQLNSRLNPIPTTISFISTKVFGKLSKSEIKQASESGLSSGNLIFSGRSAEPIRTAVNALPYVNPWTGPAFAVSTGIAQFATKGGRTQIAQASPIDKALLIGGSAIGVTGGVVSVSGQAAKLLNYPKFSTSFLSTQSATTSTEVGQITKFDTIAITQQRNILSTKPSVSVSSTIVKVSEPGEKVSRFGAITRGRLQAFAYDIITGKNIYLGKQVNFGAREAGYVETKPLTILTDSTKGAKVYQTFEEGFRFGSVGASTSQKASKIISRSPKTERFVNVGFGGKINEQVTFMAGQSSAYKRLLEGGYKLTGGLSKAFGFVTKSATASDTSTNILGSGSSILSKSAPSVKTIAQTSAKTAIESSLKAQTLASQARNIIIGRLSSQIVPITESSKQKSPKLQSRSEQSPILQSAYYGTGQYEKTSDIQLPAQTSLINSLQNNRSAERLLNVQRVSQSLDTGLKQTPRTLSKVRQNQSQKQRQLQKQKQQQRQKQVQVMVVPLGFGRVPRAKPGFLPFGKLPLLPRIRDRKRKSLVKALPDYIYQPSFTASALRIKGKEPILGGALSIRPIIARQKPVPKAPRVINKKKLKLIKNI